jgi:cell division septation protein DedD
MDSVTVRNLEQIQEEDGRRPSRLLTFALASMGGAAIVVALVMMASRASPASRSEHDPLAKLVSEARSAGPGAEQLDGRDVTFPAILSDKDAPTTALAAVRDERGRLVEQPQAQLNPIGAAEPPPATDRLPVVPLPAGIMLNATPVSSEPKDSLTALAAQASRTPDKADLALAGEDGGVELQVASFKEQLDADAFVDELRKRGHRAFRLAADVPERGIWHRVRIGPFKSRYEAEQYKKDFEKSERIAPFVVDPAQVKRADEMRAQKLKLRLEKYGRP